MGQTERERDKIGKNGTKQTRARHNKKEMKHNEKKRNKSETERNKARRNRRKRARSDTAIKHEAKQESTTLNEKEQYKSRTKETK